MNTFNDLINSEVPVLVDFFATWCGPCKMLAPVLKGVKENMGERVIILKIDVDKNKDLAAQFQVRGVPTLLLFQNGEQIWRQSGLLTKNQIIRTIIEKSA